MYLHKVGCKWSIASLYHTSSLVRELQITGHVQVQVKVVLIDIVYAIAISRLTCVCCCNKAGHECDSYIGLHLLSSLQQI